MFLPVEVLCQLYSTVPCTGDSFKGLVVQGVADGDPCGSVKGKPDLKVVLKEV